MKVCDSLPDLDASDSYYLEDMNAMDDSALLRHYAEEGSEAAFSELVRRHVSLVHSIAMRQLRGDYHRANDVTQVVFTTLARKARSLVRHTALTGWLYSCTYFSAAATKREEWRRHKREERAHDMNELLGYAEPPADWDQLRPILDEVMIELNERDRETVVWRFYDGLPLALIGQRLGVSENTAGFRVSRALDKMRASLVKRGTNSTAAALALMLANHAVMAAPAGLAESVTATALMSAASAGSQGSLFLKLLDKTKVAVGFPGAIWVGGILSISAIGAATYDLWAAWRANAALAEESAGYDAQLQGIRALKRTASIASPASTNAARIRPAVRDPNADFKEFLSAYPQARTALVSEEKAVAAMAYGSFFRSADLTPSQIAQFESACAQSWIEQMKITPRQIATGGPHTPPENQMRAILGDATYQQLQNYGPTVYAHFMASSLAGNLTEASFSADQLDQLAQILASNNPLPNPAYSLDLTSSIAAIDWETVLAQARAVFSAAQWKAAEPALLTLRAKGAIVAAQGPPGAAASQ